MSNNNNNNSAALVCSRPRVYVTRSIPQRGIDVLLENCNVSQWDSKESVPRWELINNVAGVNGILCMESDSIDKIVLDAAGPDLRAVATLSSDCSHIDTEECRKRNIRVLTLPRQSTDNMADLTVTLVLLTLKNSTENLKVDNFKECWTNLCNKTFAIFGLTSLGFAVAKRLQDMGASSIIAADPGHPVTSTNDVTFNLEIVAWDELLQRADVLVICRETGQGAAVESFNYATFQKMKKTAVLVSPEKGWCINHFNLYEALRDGEIFAAGLNDCNQEPVPFKHPLSGLSNCVFLPQAQESSYDFRHKTSVAMVQKLLGSLNLKKKTSNGLVDNS